MQNRSNVLRAKYETILRAREKQRDISVEDFCKQQNIKPCTYFYWNKKLHIAPNRSSMRPKFVPITLNKRPHQIPNIPCYEFRFANGTIMSIPDELDKEKLSELIQTIAGLP